MTLTVSRLLSLGFAVVFLWLVPVQGAAQPASAIPIVPSLAEANARLDLRQQRDAWAVVHFVDLRAGDRAVRRVREIVREAPSFAGVRQFIILAGDNEVIQETVIGSEPDWKHFYHDPQGLLASALGLDKLPGVILLTPEGEVVYRHEGRDSADLLPQRSLAAQIDRLWRDSTLAEMNLAGGVALSGYDPVSYFAEGRAEKGRPVLKSNYRGVTYHFSNEKNRRAFAESPEKFLPAYGGWDATAMAEGARVAPDPENFIISGGQLFLFYQGMWGNSREKWQQNEAELKRRADAAWSAAGSQP